MQYKTIMLEEERNKREEGKRNGGQKAEKEGNSYVAIRVLSQPMESSFPWTGV
jgi:hypothetical protein